MPVTHPSERDCRHLSTVSVISGGREEVICEDCGHVTVRYESMIPHDLERSQFRRRGDGLTDVGRSRHEADRLSH